MKSKLKIFSELIDTLRKLQVEENLEEIPPDEKNTHFEKVLDDLSRLKDEVLPARIAELKRIINSSPEKLKISTFELMDQSRLEKTHSNVMEYLFDYKLLGPKAANILSDLISRVIDDTDNDNLMKAILQCKYTVEREKSVKVGKKRGQIDLFISDDLNKFTITIENKIHAGVSSFKQEEEDDAKSQLDLYYKYVTNNYNRGNNYFILLSYQTFEVDDAPFHLIELNEFYEIISKYDIPDNIFREYRLMLFAMSRGLDVVRLTHIRQIKNIYENDLTGLNSIGQLKEMYHEI